ncbi:MAG: hypothetical protein ACLRI7_14560 [Ruthenibacterium lactatiformans]
MKNSENGTPPRSSCWPRWTFWWTENSFWHSNLDLRFRGSENQRILDVPQSLAQGRAVWCTAARWVGERQS